MDDLIERLEKKATYTDQTFSNSSLGLLYREAAAELRTLRAELERRKYDGLHTCHAECQREACVLRREVDALRAERDAALAQGVAMGIEAAVQWAKDDAKICDCSAHSEGECACGAWCEWKTVPMVWVAQNLAELDPAAIIAQHRRAQAMPDLNAADLVCGTLGDSDGDDGA